MNSTVKNIIRNQYIALLAIFLLIWLKPVSKIYYLVVKDGSNSFDWISNLFESIVILVIYIAFKVDFMNCFVKMKVMCGLLSICCSCKRIQDKNGRWHDIEEYIAEHTMAEFSHGLCQACAEKLYPAEYESLRKNIERKSFSSTGRSIKH